jgi:hypothetical protein
MCINTMVPVQFPSVLCKCTYILILGRTLLLDSNFWLRACFEASIVIVPTLTVRQFTFVNMKELFIHSVPDEFFRLLCILKMRLNTKSKTNRTLQNSEREDYLLYCWIDQYIQRICYMFSYFNLAFPIVGRVVQVRMGMSLQMDTCGSSLV